MYNKAVYIVHCSYKYITKHSRKFSYSKILTFTSNDIHSVMLARVHLLRARKLHSNAIRSTVNVRLILFGVDSRFIAPPSDGAQRLISLCTDRDRKNRGWVFVDGRLRQQLIVFDSCKFWSSNTRSEFPIDVS